MKRSFIIPACRSAIMASVFTIVLMFSADAQRRRTQATPTEIAELKKVVESDLRNLKAHEEYIRAAGIDDPGVKAQYEAWAKADPKNMAVLTAYGSALYSAEYPQAKPWLLKIVELEPKNAKVWQMLSIDAERWGDKTASREYMRKAAEAAPEDPSYAFYYAMDFEHEDPAKWRTLIHELAKRFPSSERGAQGLYWLATRSTDREEKVRVYEQLRKSYPPEKYSWSSGGMSLLFDIYLQSDAEKAVELASSLRSMQGWGEKDTLAQRVVAVNKLLAGKKFREAELLAASLKAPRYSRAANYIALLKAKARYAAGNTAAAYDSLVVLYAKLPSDELMEGINLYAQKLGKKSDDVELDIRKIREAAARPAPDFQLGLYTSNESVSLDQYRGKVVLLTFWFPGCGPCRGEFPHFEAVLDKFRDKEVAYLGINVFPEQDDYVLPFMKGTGYTFTPLRGTAEWARDVYRVTGQPTNFLIDKKGRIVFSNFRTEANNHRELELMIEALLKES